MKKALLFSLIVLLGLAGSALAVPPKLMTFYYIHGAVSSLDEAKSAGRTVVFFKEIDKGLVTTFTSATIDDAGNYRLSASANQKLLPLKFGEKCQMAVVKDAKGYGAGPTEFTFLSTGVQKVNLTMALGAGVGLVGTTPTVLEPAPTIKLWFGSRLYQPKLVTEDKPFVVAERIAVKAQISIEADYTINNDISAYSILIDDGTTAQRVLKGTDAVSKMVYAAGTVPEDKKINALSLEFNLTEPLAEGKHVFSVSAKSSGLKAGGVQTAATTLATVEVLGGPARLIGTPITNPSPYSVTKDGTVTIQYELSKDADLQIVFVSIAGRHIRNFTLNKGREGGSAGVNKVTWDGRTDRGTLVGDGIYLGTINSREDGRKLGTVKLTVLN